MVILENNKNENFKCQNFNVKCFIFDLLPRDRKPSLKILPDFRHRSNQINHIWKSQLSDPFIILPSICEFSLYKSIVSLYLDYMGKLRLLTCLFDPIIQKVLTCAIFVTNLSPIVIDVFCRLYGNIILVQNI